MFKNYLLVSFRNIWRNKAFSLINIMGLAVGINAALVVYLMVHYENSFDKFHKDSDRIYRVVSHIYFTGDSVRSAGVSVPVAAAMRENIPAVETAAPFFINDITNRIAIAGKEFRSKEVIIYADKDYFSLIQYKWLSGSPQTSLQQPFTVVLTESRAHTYFPGLSPLDVIGKEIVYDDSIHTTVSGVVSDLQGNSDFKFNEFVSIATVYGSGLKQYYVSSGWDNISSSTQLLVKLKSTVDMAKVTAQLSMLGNQHKGEGNSRTVMQLQPFSDIHFNTDYPDYINHADLKQLYALSLVALALLVLAGINFINLTTAQASRRARETGIRKSMGGTFQQLMLQFLGETFMLTLLASLTALMVAPLLLMFFKSFLPDGLSDTTLYTWPVLLFLLGLSIVVTLLAGIYPALVLARFQPVAVLKGQINAAGGKVWLRKTLTISQFMVAQFFIIATLIVSKQIHYSLNKDMGFRKDAIITVATPYYNVQYNLRNTLQEKIRTIPEVAMVSMGGQTPAMDGSMSNIFIYKDGKKEIAQNVEMRYGDTAYVQVYQLKILAGRNLKKSDTVSEWVLNEKATKAFGFKDPRGILGVIINNHPVVGVVSDFNTRSVHTEIPAMALTSSAAEQHRIMHVLLRNPGKGGMVWSHAITKIEKAWKEVYPRDEFKYEFLDKTIENLYTSEQQTARLLNWCAGLAFFISALGLLGLVIFTTNQRTREIGIRKVLGATVWQMVSLLTLDFMKLVVIAFVLAIPLSWWVIHHWLESFVYRTAMSWWIFAIGGAVMAILALATISVKTIRAAWSNPVNALRSE
ncbi:ABC-type antimicrobial peptide transport system permease subunit [Chitinophaga niastensis]|uniref:ABC-type antimicrobial peptide transport system permease subunit n=1 Tax=Chitinophaga niastensis TaxID=536980 RepID=A0A2P8HS91_CHINA|nr:ABC transporter permease [Chitinophaga niastensis]PSL49065.1 ABC-type antimicrobial peptide transport system permease subunit [Chitinophaga niastensis]